MREPRELRLDKNVYATYIGSNTWVVVCSNYGSLDTYKVYAHQWERPSELYGAFLELYLNGDNNV